MTMPHELDAEAWLVELLGSDPQITDACPGGIHMHPAPTETEYPVITFKPIPSPDLLTVDGHRVMVRGLWRVAIWFTEDDDMRPTARDLDELLHRGSGTHGGYRVRAHRDRSWSSSSVESGDLIYAIGGWYRFETSL